ncbi:MAG TPA: hypothetical protein VL172_14935, partial [Kofleriaceae bacterium]|nr:hypothetical protein [Kofleriaceae bacterium]
PPAVRIRLIGAVTVELSDAGDCPGHADERLVRSSAGSGCVAAMALASLGLMAAREQDFLDHHLLAVDADRPRSIRISGAPPAPAITLTARGGGWISETGVELDGDAVRAWGVLFDDLAGDPSPCAGLGALRERGRVALDYGGGRVEQVLLQADPTGRLWVARTGEPVCFAAAPPAAAVFTPAIHPFLGRIRWQEEPTALRVATRTRGAFGEHGYQGGRVVEEIERGLEGRPLEDWVARYPAGATVATATADALAEAGARFVATAVVAERPAPTHGLFRPRALIDLEFTTPAGDSRFRHRIAVGNAAAKGCYATGDDQPAVLLLDAASCAALLGPWTTPPGG